MINLPRKEYFQGIMQLRECTPELIEWVKETTRNDKKALITREKRMENGVDLYFSSQKYLQAVGKKLKSKFAGILKVSQRQHTTHRVTSKILYRVTVFFRQLPFKRGDTINYQGEELQVLSVNKRAQVKNIKTGEKREINLEDLRKARH